jgi:hypothetical protein
MAAYTDPVPLKVADPKPAAWTPPAKGEAPRKKAKNK